MAPFLHTSRARCICVRQVRSSLASLALIPSLTLPATLVLCGCSSSPKADDAAARPQSELALHAESQGNYLRLTWNRHAPILAKARGGILVIEDGDQPKRELPLSAELLRSGSVLYQPASNNLRFRLDITSTQSVTAFGGHSAEANNQNGLSVKLPEARAADTTERDQSRASPRQPVTLDKAKRQTCNHTRIRNTGAS